ncbi:hypothetical protein, partial [Acinetobacter baumannii]|uniref:hypothetical protein n=1 Tax=Acinetobacter baumannii TaxID=470 RepID=UPI001BB46902
LTLLWCSTACLLTPAHIFFRLALSLCSCSRCSLSRLTKWWASWAESCEARREVARGVEEVEGLVEELGVEVEVELRGEGERERARRRGWASTVDIFVGVCRLVDAELW